MLTDFDIQKLSISIVDNLVNNDKFISRVAKMMEKRSKRLVNSSRAAEILGVTRKTICEIAPFIGGIRGKGQSAHWMFEEDGLIERYIEYKNC
jgi:hypothetical protein